MTQRGSALLNVLMVVSVLMILGLLALQMAAADANFSKGNLDRARAFQLAEGGIDYGIELLIGACPLGVEYPLSLESEGEIIVTVDAHPDLDHHYLIKSRGQRGSAVSNIELLVQYYPWDAAFTHALFIGDSGTDTLELKNVTIDGETYIGAREVVLEKVLFKDDTHFAGETVSFSNTCDKDILALVTRGSSTQINPPDFSHWSAGIMPEDKELPFPSIALERFADNYYNWGGTNALGFWELKETNFFTRDVVITVDKKEGMPVWNTTIIVSLGSVTFEVPNQVNDYSGTLVIMADGDIVGVDKIAPGADPQGEDQPNKPAPSIYLYSREGTIVTEQNIRGLRAVIAEELTLSHTQVQTIRPPNLNNQLIDEVWKNSVTPVQWSN